MECQFCKKLCKNDNSLRNHERLCKENPNSQKIVSHWIEYNNKLRSGKITKINSNQHVKAKLEGTKYTVKEETRKKISEASRRYRHSPESIQKLKKSMRDAVLNNPDSYTASNVSGRTPIIIYNGIKLKGSWEVETAKWLNRQSIEWTNTVKGFDYFWQGSTHTYFPDFYLPLYNVYIEVKGYERDRDRCKWKVVNNLIVLKKDDIAKIKQDKLNIKDLIGPLA